MLKIALINGITMGILNFYHFFTYFGPFFILFDPFLAFGYIWGQITIDCHMHIYKLCKKCTHKWYFYGIFNFYHFLTYFEPFLTLFWPLVIFWINFLYIVICAYINCVIMLKIALINGITMGIFNFYPFLPILDPFLTFFDPF